MNSIETQSQWRRLVNRVLSGAACLAAVGLMPADASSQTRTDPSNIPAIQTFLAGGFGEMNSSAPPQTADFGRLVGLWETEQQMRAADGSWVGSDRGYWAWKYALNGFAVRDLWFQSGSELPSYMTNLGRDYLLTGMRIFDRRAGQWKVAWMANGTGLLQGADFGTFEAKADGGDVIQHGPPIPGVGLQRVVFSDINDGSFTWTSEYSQDDGVTWIAVMRVRATRIPG